MENQYLLRKISYGLTGSVTTPVTTFWLNSNELKQANEMCVENGVRNYQINEILGSKRQRIINSPNFETQFNNALSLNL